MKLEHGTPMDIEGESMRIIREELSAMGVTLPPDRAAAVLRAIHTTADFDYAQNLWFTPGAVEAGGRPEGRDPHCHRHQYGPLRDQPDGL